MTIEWNHDNPLELCKDETRPSNESLHDYWYMGNERSLPSLARQYTEKAQKAGKKKYRRLRTLKGWSTNYDWQARIRRAQQIEDERIADLWRQRQTEWREQEWEIADRISKKVQTMLDFPLSRRIVDGDDGTRITIEPVNWRASDIARMIEAASKLARLSASIEDLPTKVVTYNIDYSKLTRNQLRRIANGDPIDKVLEEG